MNDFEKIKSLMPLDIQPQTLQVVSERTKDRMKAYIISMINDHESTVATRKIMQSIRHTESNVQPFIFPAVVPLTLQSTMTTLFGKSTVPNIGWTYPTKDEENRYDLKTGLQLSAYKTADLHKRISCTLSHYSLWLHCYNSGEPIMILEHDAFFTRKFDYKDIKDSFTGHILGLCHPVGATRKANVYQDAVRSYHNDLEKKLKAALPYSIQSAPTIDKNVVPQGIAGNSAYIIKPEGAAKLIALTAEHGLWPNDAIMCKQLMPSKLQIVYPYYTKVQGLISTTSL